MPAGRLASWLLCKYLYMQQCSSGVTSTGCSCTVHNTPLCLTHRPTMLLALSKAPGAMLTSLLWLKSLWWWLWCVYMVMRCARALTPTATTAHVHGSRLCGKANKCIERQVIDTKAVQVQDAASAPALAGHELGAVHDALCGTVAMLLVDRPGATACATGAQRVVIQVAVVVGCSVCVSVNERFVGAVHCTITQLRLSLPQHCTLHGVEWRQCSLGNAANVV